MRGALSGIVIIYSILHAQSVLVLSDCEINHYG